MISETYEAFAELLVNIFSKNSITNYATDQNIEQFYKFTNTLTEANAKTNLTAIDGTRDVIIKHFADSLLAADRFPEGKTVIDVGCGAGFPSIPLAIVRPDLKITALDSTGKKIDFVKYAATELKLVNITPICDRAEAFITKDGLRESFDCATARAVSRLNVLTELTLPFVKLGGRFIAMKAKDGITEVKEAEHGIDVLGGRISDIYPKKLFDIDFEIGERTIIEIEKISETPKKYPRAYARIAKSPI